MSDYIDIGQLVASNVSFSVISLNNRDGDGINIGDPVMVNIKDKDGNDKGSIGEVKWIGLINNKKCVGVDMEDEFEYGMDGTINEDIRFACLPKHGLITLLSNVKLYNFDKKLEKLENGMINPNKYIQCEHGVLIGKFKVGDSVFVCVKTKIGKNKVKGTLRWCGLMNGIPVGAVELSEDCENGTNGRFWRHKLFKCGEMRAVVVVEDNIMTYTPIKYDGNCFVANSYRFNDEEISRENEKYKIGQLLKAKTDPVLYGEADFFMNHCGKSLVGMLLDESQLSKHETFLQNKIVGKPYFKKDHVGIIAKEKIMEIFQEEIIFLNNSKLIDENSIKYKKEKTSNDFQKNDLIKFINDDNVVYKITKVVQINGIHCCEVQEAVLPSQIFYVNQRDICKIKQIELRKSIYDCVLLDPARINNFERCKFEDLEEGCNVKFKSNDSSKLLKGIVKSVGNADGVSCCVVELACNVDNEIFCYKINERKVLKKLIGNAMQPTVIVLAHALRRNIKLLNNGINILDPRFITQPKGETVVEKYIIFNYESKKNVLKVKWKGIASKIPCLGCEMQKISKYGTNGYFGGEQLFKCRDECGVLIHFDDLAMCCELTGHKCLKKKKNDSIDEDCICCVKWVAKLNGNNQLKINDSVKRANENEYKILKWIGLVNNVEVIGVESQYEVQQSGTDGTFCGIKFFDCQNKCGALFEASEFTIIKLKLNYLKYADLNIIDQYSIRSIENGQSNRKSMILKSKLKIQMLNLKWRGCINGHLCVGVELNDIINFGTDGMFNGERLFQCENKQGVLIPVDELKGCCESDLNHEDIVLHNDNLVGYLFGYMKSVNPDYICCVEWLDKIKTHPQLQIGSRIKYKKDGKDIDGTCEWIGLINGKEAIGARMDCKSQKGFNGTFNSFELFNCPNGSGFLFLAEDIHHDIPYEFEVIPLEKRIFKNIDLNSDVIYYYPSDKELFSLYGTVRWSGIDENNEYFYGIELDDRSNNGTDGTFKGQRLFQCRNGHGVLASINHVALDSRFTEIVVSPDNITQSEVSKQVQFGVLVKLSNGLNKGIQGNANSSSFDAAIFALFVNSDVLDFMLSPMINETESNEITKQFRDIMAWKIINPLREYGYVSFHRTEEMREVIKQYGPSFEEMTKQETDIGNVSILLSKFCPKEQLLKIISLNRCQTNSMFLQLFISLKNKSEYMTSEEMINLSMIQNGIMFEEHPTCLIAKAPRDARGINCYDFVLPLDIIEISNICSNNWKKCNSCEKEAIFQCSECIDENKLDICCGFRCKIHSCRHKEKIKLNKSNSKARSKVFMELKAIICIEKCHFVSYVKQVEMKTEKWSNEVKKWFCFDSMSTKSKANNYAIPNVFQSKDVTHFMNLSYEDMKNDIECYRTTDLKRIIKDSHVFIYHNSAKTCY